MHKYKTCWKRLSEVKILSEKGKKHIALIAGGMSAEREVSLISAEGVKASLVDAGYKVTFIDMGADIANVLQEVKPDIVFNCLHGTYGEDGSLQGLLNIMRIPYTHSGVLTSALCYNKISSRVWFKENNINVVDGIILSKTDNIKKDPIKRPYVIKPLDQGSSIGVEVVFENDDFNFVNYDFPYGDQIIIEKYIKGRELQVAVLDSKALGVLEIKLLKNRFYDYETKYTEGFAKHLCPAPLPSDIYSKLLVESEKIFNITKCKSVARVEFILEDHTNKLFILEINTHPGLTPLSIVPEIALNNGINFTALIEKILETANFES